MAAVAMPCQSPTKPFTLWEIGDSTMIDAPSGTAISQCSPVALIPFASQACTACPFGVRAHKHTGSSTKVSIRT